jgi:uncharacterized protein DUF3291
MSDGFHLAQLNIGRSRGPMDAPMMADFMAGLEPINALAESSPGYVWRLQTEGGNATSIHAYDDPLIIVNLTVWESIESLAEFVLRTAHRDYLRRRREWFERMADAYVVLWWIPAGTIPTLSEARERLERLRRHGPTAEAFTFRVQFPSPSGAPAAAVPAAANAAPA